MSLKRSRTEAMEEEDDALERGLAALIDAEAGEGDSQGAGEGDSQIAGEGDSQGAWGGDSQGGGDSQDGGEGEVVAHGEAVDIESSDEDDRSEFAAKIDILQKFSMVLHNYNQRIEGNDYTTELKHDLENLVLEAKLLESFYEHDQPEQSAPTTLRRLREEWVKLKPIVLRFACP
jgi:hypothetical protein